MISLSSCDRVRVALDHPIYLYYYTKYNKKQYTPIMYSR